jgi:DMSO/TMAO reductase YedYZ heme-binding membrane subunit
MTFRGLDPRTQLARWGLVAVAIGIVLGATLPRALDAVVLTLMTRPENVPWYAERLVGFLAYFALAASVLYGLLLSTKLLDAIAHRPITFALHQDLAAFGLGLAGIHGALLGLDHSIPFSLAQIAIPFSAPYSPVWVGVGQVAFYVSLAVVASFYARRRIGQRAWRALHYLTFLAFAGATAHGIAAGTDSGTPWAWWIYAASVAAVAFLLTYRIVLSAGIRLGASDPRRPARIAARPRPAVPSRPVTRAGVDFG